MTQEDKELLLKDLSGRLPYGVKLRYIEDCVVKKVSHTITMDTVWLEHVIYGDVDIKPYLRPMSSMTEEEWKEYNQTIGKSFSFTDEVDWLNEHHFDYRGLIEKGLAIEVTEENNPYK